MDKVAWPSDDCGCEPCNLKTSDESIFGSVRAEIDEFCEKKDPGRTSNVEVFPAKCFRALRHDSHVEIGVTVRKVTHRQARYSGQP